MINPIEPGPINDGAPVQMYTTDSLLGRISV